MNALLIRLYPASWRARYGDEFEAMLEGRPLGPFDVADILLGALDAHLRLRRHGAHIGQGRRFSMSLRIGGFAAIFGAALWTVGIAIGFQNPGVPAPPMLITGALAMLVALVCLSAVQARTHPRLAWAAFALPAVGTIVSIVGLVGIVLVGERYEGLFYLGFFSVMAGSALFGIATYRTAVLSRQAAILLVGGLVLIPVAFLVMMVSWALGMLTIGASFICVPLGWFAMGAHALRVDRPAAERPA